MSGTDGLEALRADLDRTDARLLEALGDRIDCCVAIARHKQRHGVPMMQEHRIDLVQRRAAEFGRARGVDETFLRRLYDLIIEETCRVEDRIIDGPAAGRRAR